MGLGNLDVVTEDAVVAHFQRLDPGPATLARLKIRDPILGVAARVANLVELCIKPTTDKSAVLYRHGRIIDDRPLDQAEDLWKVG